MLLNYKHNSLAFRRIPGAPFVLYKILF